MPSADNIYKQFGPRRGPTFCRSSSGSKLFGPGPDPKPLGALRAFLKI